MRVGIVSPYSYTYPGGVGRHAEALSERLIATGHEVSLLTPCDPDDRLARVTHGGISPQPRPLPAHVVPLGRTVGIPVNGGVSNLALSCSAVARLGHALRRGRFDVVHVHEPNAPVVSWFATEASRAALVGTFHTGSTSSLANGFASRVVGARRLYDKLHMRVAVSEAARWTAERWYGGRYRIIPNGVDLGAASRSNGAGSPAHAERFEVLFIGRSDERKGLPVLLRAFEALRCAGVSARLTIAGPTADEVEPWIVDPDGIRLVGAVGEERWDLLAAADVLCAPSVGGESFGMVLTEAFAAGTPVVCSDIPGYREVARHGVEGLLVPPADAVALGEALLGLASDGERRRALGGGASARAHRYSWDRVADELVEVYEEARELATERAAAPAATRAAARLGLRPANPAQSAPPRRIPPLDTEPRGAVRRRGARKLAVGAGGLLAAGLTALALDRIGIDSVLASLIAAAPVWVLVAVALMSASMLLRAGAWNAIIHAAIPGARVSYADTARATMIGVLMSATLPARLGEPSRALIVARRLGRVREKLPLVLGTIVSQTLLNVLALVVLGAVMFATVGLFHGNEDKLVWFTFGPLILLSVVLVAPTLLRTGKQTRSARIRRGVVLVQAALAELRRGLVVFRSRRLGAQAVGLQLGAWAIQWLSCYALLVALGLDERAGLGAAAAVLFAVNVTAVLPLTPSNLGVFQAVCVAVLSAYGVGHSDALAYGIVLQAVEIATSLAMGMPALLREGLSWKDMRLRALHAAPVELAGAPRPAEPAEAGIS